jgi:hypothetical protein
MRRQTVVGLVALVALVAFAAGLSVAAAPKQYQFTGQVVDYDAKSKMISVDKGGDIWEFSTDASGLAGAKVKKGDKVTVHYRMVATKIESK